MEADVSPAPRIGPVPVSERITVIDCLRGAALFGILTANMRGFAAPAVVYFNTERYWTGLPDRIVQGFVDWLISGKFVTIFAALFGIGFAILMERAAARGLGAGFYFRRMTVLLLFGTLHSFLLWWGDILMSYAVCGYFLLFFRKRAQRTILWWAHGMYWLIALIFLGFYIASLAGAQTPNPPEPTAESIRETIRIYADGSYAEIFRKRAAEWAMINAFLLVLTHILGLFLYGLYLWRQGYLREPAQHIDWWKKAQRISAPIGLIGNLINVGVTLLTDLNPMRPSLVSMFLIVLQFVSVPALSLFYASTVVLLFQRPEWRERLMPFSYVGRMALTNYLLQSLICTTIFYSYGLGLYGTVGPALAVPLSILVYGLQVPFSKWWLSRYRYGPMEWLWRRLTYGRSETAAAAAA